MEAGTTAGFDRRWPAGLLAALAVVAFAAECLRAPQVHLDLAPLYGAAILLSEGRLGEAYATDPSDARYAGPALTTAVRERAYPVRRVLRFLHPPPVAALLLPLAALEFPEAVIVWRTLSLLALAVAAYLLVRRAGARTGLGAVAFCGLLLFDPARATLDLGQTNAFVLLLVAVALNVRSRWTAGVAIGIAALLKSWVALVPLAWVLARPREEARSGLGALLVALVVGLAAFSWDPEGTGAWLDMLGTLSGMQFLWPEQQSVAAQAARFLTGFTEQDVAGWTDRAVAAGAATWVGHAWAGLVLTLVCAVAFLRRPGPFAMAALAVPAGLAASPVLHAHYGLLLVVPAAWVLSRGRIGFPGGLVLAGLALQALPLHLGEAGYWSHYVRGDAAAWFFVSHRLAGVLLALAGMAWALFRGDATAGDGVDPAREAGCRIASTR